jgi:uncharacterized protein (TIGR01244 family)
MSSLLSVKTLKTTVGYVATLLRRAGLLKVEGKSIEQIFNYVRISEDLGTSGQPSALELQKIRDAGFSTVINLAPHDAENSLRNEATIVTDLGLRYVHIPVDFRNPTERDFAAFTTAMSDVAGTSVWVHCAANMRVSAFVYKYRRDVLGADNELAIKDLHKIWEPFGVWKTFVNA